MSCSSASSTRSTSKRRERSNVVVPESEVKKTPSSSCPTCGARLPDYASAATPVMSRDDVDGCSITVLVRERGRRGTLPAGAGRLKGAPE
jgi:hypothetical protein